MLRNFVVFGLKHSAWPGGRRRTRRRNIPLAMIMKNDRHGSLSIDLRERVSACESFAINAGYIAA